MGQKKRKAERGQEMAKKSTESFEGRGSKSISKQAVCPGNVEILPATTPKLVACKELQQAWGTDLLGSPDTLPRASSTVLSTSIRVRGSEGANKKLGMKREKTRYRFRTQLNKR